MLVSMTAWPELSYARWQPTGASLHMWAPIVGKFRLARVPWVNHSWHATLYVNGRGLTTSLVPGPDGFADARVEPTAATFLQALGEFVLPYEAVRTAPDPEAALMAFLASTYEAAATLGRWDRAALECPQGVPRVPRAAAS